MEDSFKVGDEVQWSWQGGKVRGKVTHVHHADFTFMGRQRRASKTEPQYEVESDRTGNKAAHKGSALSKI